MNEIVRNNSDLSQLELYFDENLVGRVEYTLLEEYIEFKYIYVDPNYRGMKISTKLATMAYNYQKEVALPAEVTCGVLNSILKKNSDYNDFLWL